MAFYRLAALYWASQVELMVENLPANSGDRGDTSLIPGQETPLEEAMATHSRILAWRIPMDKGAWRATGHGITESDTTE